MNKEEQNVEILLRQLKESQDSEYRVKAAEKLGTKKEFLDRIIPALVEALNDENLFVRVEAAASLSRIGRPALSSLDTLKVIINEPRNRTKRGSFYEFIHTLEEISKTEPEPLPARRELEIHEPLQPLIEEEVSEMKGELIEQESIIKKSFEVEEITDADIPKEVLLEKERKEVIIEEKSEIVIENVHVNKEFSEPVFKEVEEIHIKFEEELDEEITEKLNDELQELEEKIDTIEVIEVVGVEKETEESLEVGEKQIENVLEKDLEVEGVDTTEEEIGIKVEEISVKFETTIEGKVGLSQENIGTEIDEETKELPLSDVLIIEEEEEKEKLKAEEVSFKKITKTLLKIIIVGDEGVGKTTLRKLISTNNFKSEYKEAIGVDFSSKEVKREGEEFILQFWDVIGKDQLIVIKDLFFRGVIGAILVFDISQRESFTNIHSWFREISQVESNTKVFVLVGNKSDLRRQGTSTYVNKSEGEVLANKLSLESGTEIQYFEISALTRENVSEAMTFFIEKVFSIYTK